MPSPSSICVFAGSATGVRPAYRDGAETLGRTLAERGITVVYGGAAIGLMGALADAALDAGGRVVGVIPQHLVDREIAHPGLSELHVVAGMHERKARMAAEADAFVALPGGAGTLEELFEIWTWALIGLHAKPFGVLDTDGYYRDLRHLADRMVSEGFLRADHRDMLHVDADVASLLERLAAYVPPPPKFARGSIDTVSWIHVVDGRLLVVRSEGNELFYLPGGKIEPGEAPLDALTREIEEELGVHLDAVGAEEVDTVEAPADGYAAGTTVRMRCYRAPHRGEPTPAGEIAELAWVGPHDLHRVPPAGAAVLRRLVERGEVR